MNEEADQSDTMLRVSCDAKAAVKIGAFSRLGHSRVSVAAADHDFKAEEVVGYAHSMTWKGHAPVVTVINRVYQTGVRLTQALMAEVEAQLSRFEALGRWFIDISGSRIREAVT